MSQASSTASTVSTLSALNSPISGTLSCAAPQLDSTSMRAGDGGLDARRARTDPRPGQSARALRAGARGDDQLRRGKLPGELRAELVIDVDHARREPRPGEETRLGVGVGRHGAVIVEMIAREIGERRGMEAHAADPMLIERVRGDLHAHHLGAERPHGGEPAVNGHRIGGGVVGGGEQPGNPNPIVPM